MYKNNPNTSKTEVAADKTSFAELLKEVNSTIDELSVWRETEKQKNEEFERNLQQKAWKPSSTHDETKEEEEEEEMPTGPTAHTIDFEKYRVKAQPFTVAAVALPKAVCLPAQPQFEGFQMFEAGHRLTELLEGFAAETSDVFAGNEQTHHSEEWDQLEDIENELKELEQLLDRKPA